MQRCAVISTLKLFSAKWKPCILSHLLKEPARFGALKRKIPNITKKMLSQHLTELEKDGLINRNVFTKKPLKVVYSLTQKGQSLERIFVELEHWGLQHQSDVESIEVMLSGSSS
jgi:DNA-binding HxlR family transcriptional regulator